MRTSSHAHICHKWMRGFRLSRKAQAEKTKKNTNRWLPPSEFWVWNFEFWFILGFASDYELFSFELEDFILLIQNRTVHNAPWRIIPNSKLKIPNSDGGCRPLPCVFYVFPFVGTVMPKHHSWYRLKDGCREQRSRKAHSPNDIMNP